MPRAFLVAVSMSLGSPPRDSFFAVMIPSAAAFAVSGGTGSRSRSPLAFAVPSHDERLAAHHFSNPDDYDEAESDDINDNVSVSILDLSLKDAATLYYRHTTGQKILPPADLERVLGILVLREEAARSQFLETSQSYQQDVICREAEFGKEWLEEEWKRRNEAEAKAKSRVNKAARMKRELQERIRNGVGRRGNLIKPDVGLERSEKKEDTERVVDVSAPKAVEEVFADVGTDVAVTQDENSVVGTDAAEALSSKVTAAADDKVVEGSDTNEKSKDISPPVFGRPLEVAEDDDRGEGLTKVESKEDTVGTSDDTASEATEAKATEVAEVKEEEEEITADAEKEAALLKQQEEEEAKRREEEEAKRRREEEARAAAEAKAAAEAELRLKKEEEAREAARVEAKARAAAEAQAKAAAEAEALRKKQEEEDALLKPLKEKATGVTFEPKLETGLYLTGAGVRKKAILNVYALGMYTSREAKGSISSLSDFNDRKQAIEVLRSEAKENGPTSFVLQMVFKIGSDAMANALGENVGDRHKGDRKYVDELKKLMADGLKGKGAATKGTTFQFDCNGDAGLTVSVDGVERGTVLSRALSDACVDMYLDEKSVCPTLKDSILAYCCN